jgi:hypothetical protein
MHIQCSCAHNTWPALKYSTLNSVSDIWNEKQRGVEVRLKNADQTDAHTQGGKRLQSISMHPIRYQLLASILGYDTNSFQASHDTILTHPKHPKGYTCTLYLGRPRKGKGWIKGREQCRENPDMTHTNWHHRYDSLTDNTALCIGYIAPLDKLWHKRLYVYG